MVAATGKRAAFEAQANHLPREVQAWVSLPISTGVTFHSQREMEGVVHFSARV